MKDLWKFLKGVKDISIHLIWGVIIWIVIGGLLLGLSDMIFGLKIFGVLYLIGVLIGAYFFIAERELRNGPLVAGTVVSAKKRILNNNEFLDVTVQFFTTDGQQVTASNSIDFPHSSLELFQPGFPSPYLLRYDPENPEKIKLELEGMSEAALERSLTTYSEKVKNGSLVIGTIVSVEVWSFKVNSKSLFKIAVQFDMPDGQQITAFGQCLISPDIEQIMWLQPQEMIALRYNPENPEQIMLELHEKQKTLERAREVKREKAKNGPLVVGMAIALEPPSWSTDDIDVTDVAVYFKTIDGQEVTTQKRMIFPKNASPDSTGGLIFIRYNPENPEQIEASTGEDEATLQRVLDAYKVASGLMTQEEIDMTRHGVKATGVVLSAQPTGNIVDGCGEMALRMKVTRPDGGTYEAAINKAVPQDKLPSVQPGSELEVFYMPENEENIAVLL
jgi:hypothetical protein